MRTYQYNIAQEMLIDNFAGGGGASTGIELATGRIVDIAINHNRAAIQMHEKNHPYTKHFCEDVWQINPLTVTQGRPVAVVWGSPDCTHFSKAKGGTPVEKKIRGLAWVLCKWAGTVKPRVIIMENVEEFMTWGPVIPMRYKGRCVKKITKENGKTKYITAEKGEELSEEEQIFVPDKKRAGQTFERFVAQLRVLGYEVDWKVMTACDYGAPTKRKRFFLIARRDGKPIVFPKPTHGVGKGLKPYRTAAECIDWSIQGKSIFGRKHPLKTNTMKRIARGLDKFVIKSPNPFIMCNNTGNIPHSVNEPCPTITTGVRNYVCVPYLSQYFSGEKQSGSDIQKPMPTVTSIDHNALVAVSLSSRYGDGADGRGQPLDKPLNTVTGTNHSQLIGAHLIKYYSGEEQAQSVKDPLHTSTTKQSFCLATSHICTLRNNMDGQAVTEPLTTITSHASHHAEIRTYLTKLTGNETNLGCWNEVRKMLNEYAGYDIKDNEILIMEIDKIQYFISDIAMRMLEPKELARAQGFPPDYVLQVDESYTKSDQIARIGNSVCPVMAEVLVRANLPELCPKKKIKTMEELNDVLTA